MSSAISASDKERIAAGVAATRKSRSLAARVTSSLVLSEIIVEMRTRKGLLSRSAIAETDGNVPERSAARSASKTDAQCIAPYVMDDAYLAAGFFGSASSLENTISSTTSFDLLRLKETSSTSNLSALSNSFRSRMGSSFTLLLW